MNKKLKRSFYGKPTLKVAKSLLGKYIVRVYRGKKIYGKIVETEAYIGPRDRASHSYGGRRTARNDVMYWPGGHAYLYFVYGMHWMFNVVTGKFGKPEAVLIRSIETAEGKNPTIGRGPGKTSRYFKLNESFNTEDLIHSKRLWIENRSAKPEKIDTSERVGIDYAGIWAKKRWRFFIQGNPCASKISKKRAREGVSLFLKNHPMIGQR